MASPLTAALMGGQGGESAAMFGMDPTIMAATPDLQLGQAMIQGGLSTAPASPWQALARVAQTGAGSYLKQGAISDLAKAYSGSAEHMAQVIDQVSPGSIIPRMLRSDDPIVRMQGMQLVQKGALQINEPHDVRPGNQVRQPGVPGPLTENTNPQTPAGQAQRDLTLAAHNNPAAVPALTSAATKAATDNGIILPSIQGQQPGPPMGPPRIVAPTTPTAAVPPPNPQKNQRAAAIPGFADANASIAATKAAAEESAKNPALIERSGASEQAKNPALIERAGASEAAKNPALITRAGEVAQAENPALISRAGGVAAAKAPYEGGGEGTIQTPTGPQQIPITAETRRQIQPGSAPVVPSAAVPPPEPGAGKDQSRVPSIGGKPLANPAIEPAVAADTKELAADRELAIKGQQDMATVKMIQDFLPKVQTGWSAESKLEAARILKAAGVNDVQINDWMKTDVTSGQILQKKFLELSAAAARGMGAREPGSVISMFAKAYPNLGTDPDAVKLQTNALYMDRLRQQKLAEQKTTFLNESINGVQGTGQYRGLKGFNEVFNKSDPAEKYLSAAEAMSGVGQGWKRIKDPAQQQAVIDLIPAGMTYMAPDGTKRIHP